MLAARHDDDGGFICLCIYMYVHIYVNIWSYMHVYVYIHISIYICIYTCVCVCVLKGAAYVFIVCLDYVFRTTIDKIKVMVSSWQRKEVDDTLHKQLWTRTTPMTQRIWQIHPLKPKPCYIVWHKPPCQRKHERIHVL